MTKEGRERQQIGDLVFVSMDYFFINYSNMNKQSFLHSYIIVDKKKHFLTFNKSSHICSSYVSDTLKNNCLKEDTMASQLENCL